MSTLKHRGKGPQVMTANELRQGPVVYMTRDYAWSTAFTDALQTEDSRLIENMGKAADEAVEANIVVGAYFIDIDPETRQPARYRERFRMNGPSFDPGVPTHAEHIKTHGASVFGVNTDQGER